jgi:hypothetical protein
MYSPEQLHERFLLQQRYQEGTLSEQEIEDAYDNDLITMEEFANYMEIDNPTCNDLSKRERQELENWLQRL